MNQVTRNAPFGTENTPVVDVKIVGGKRVEVPAVSYEKDSNGDHNHHTKASRLHQQGPNGTPSMLNQPVFSAYERSHLQGGFSTPEQHALAREVSSYTSPVGDRSHSFRHGATQQFNNYAVLPSILPKTAGVYRYNPQETKKDSLLLPDLDLVFDTDSTATPLEIIIKKSFKNFNMNRIKDMYIELTSFDRTLTGYADESHITLVALRYDLPLKPVVLKAVMKKFADETKPSKVNYEKLLQYIVSSCSAKSPVKKVEINLENNTTSSRDNKQPTSQQRGRPSNDTPPSNPPHFDTFINMLREQLAEATDFDANDLAKALLSISSSKRGELTAEPIERTCNL